MKRLLVNTLLAAGLLFLISSCNDATTDETAKTDSLAATPNQGDTSSMMRTAMHDDAKFAMEAAEGGMMEVQLGKLASTSATSSAVKQHAKMMVEDHSKVNAELKQLAASKNITLPDSLSGDKKKEIKDLAEKKGADFDKAYTDFMVDDHKKDVDKFKEASEKCNDADLKAWAAAKLPTLQSHLQMWQAIKDGTPMKH